MTRGEMNENMNKKHEGIRAVGKGFATIGLGLGILAILYLFPYVATLINQFLTWAECNSVPLVVGFGLAVIARLIADIIIGKRKHQEIEDEE